MPLSLDSSFHAWRDGRRPNVTSGRPLADIHILKRVARPFPAFRERSDAGHELVEFIKKGPQESSVVLALPRGRRPRG